VRVRDDIELRVVDDPAQAGAELLARAASAGGHVALSGGFTPKKAYELAAAMTVDWAGATIWFGDDRCVPSDHELSNYRMAREALLDRVDPGPEVHRIKGELGPHEAADEYELKLRDAFDGATPRLDLALMGLGPDLHTASLFPGRPALDERDRLAVGVDEAGMEPYVPRVTLTLPVFNASAEVVFLVTGADKADAVAGAFGREPRPEAPASLVRPESGRLVLLCDAGAADKL
jgi:6-phosphogluconolactonase